MDGKDTDCLFKINEPFLVSFPIVDFCDSSVDF
jgi:hypothetical protein